MIYRIFYVLNEGAKRLVIRIKRIYYMCRGAHIKKNVAFSKLYFTWPHKVAIDEHCVIEHGVYFKHADAYSKGKSIIIGKNVFIGTGTEFNIKHNISIGNDCLIASGCRFVDHDHGITEGTLIRVQKCPGKEIVIAEDVWVGANSIILKGVVIGKGAVIAGGAVVNKSVPPNEIWGGVPARKIGKRK